MQLTKEHHFQLLQRMVSPDHRAAYFKAAIDQAAVNLSTAENILLVKFLQEKAFSDLGPITEQTIRYPLSNNNQIYGAVPYLQGLQEFINHQWNVSVDYTNIFGASGVVAALEVLALALFKPGDEVLLPAPMWYGFHWSFSQTAGMKYVPFPIDEGFNLTAANVKSAMEKNPKAKLLVLTNPNNPLGTNYSKTLQEEIYELFLGAGPDKQIISDEIYACSQVKDQSEFVSALILDAYRKYPNRIHVTYGLSKDFGLAGFRAGFIVSQSKEVQNAIHGDECFASSIWFSPFVTLNTYTTRKLFMNDKGAADPRLANKAMEKYKKFLEKQYDETKEHLDKGNIKYYSANNGAIFFWIDLRDYLNRVPSNTPFQPLCPTIYKNDDKREGQLLNYIQTDGHLLLVRGQECFNVEPGFFRLCYTAEELDQVKLGIDGMVRALNKLPQAP